MTEVFTKIKDNPIFKSDPDKVVRNFILPQYKRTMVEVLDDFIAVKFYSSLSRDGTVKMHRHYHYTQGGKLIKALGNADEITFEGARILLKKLISNSHTNGVAAPKNTLVSVFKIYCEYNAFAERTLRKLRFRFQSRLKCVSDKDISKITKKEIMQILDPIYKNRKFALLKDLFYFIRSLFRFARDRGISDNLLFCDTQLKNLYKIPKSGGYSYISANADLKLLIKYIMSYPYQIGVKNALICGLLTGLRSSNVRNLTHEHLKVDDDGEYYLLFLEDENKVKSNGDEYLGIPKEVGKWLESIKTKPSLFFANTEGNVLSEATLVKALRQYTPLVGNNGIVFHSFRIILSTFCNDNLADNGLIPEIIERTIFHRVRGVAGVYNKATNIKNTRKVLTWWLGYLKELGFKF